MKYDVESPVLGKIMDILSFDSTILLYVQDYVGELFCSHFNAFVMKTIGQFQVLNMFALEDHHPLLLVHLFCNLTMICMQFFLFTTDLFVLRLLNFVCLFA